MKLPKTVVSKLENCCVLEISSPSWEALTALLQRLSILQLIWYQARSEQLCLSPGVPEGCLTGCLGSCYCPNHPWHQISWRMKQCCSGTVSIAHRGRAFTKPRIRPRGWVLESPAVVERTEALAVSLHYSSDPHFVSPLHYFKEPSTENQWSLFPAVTSTGKGDIRIRTMSVLD